MGSNLKKTVKFIFTIFFMGIIFSCSEQEKPISNYQDDETFISKKAQFKEMVESLGQYWAEDSELTKEEVEERNAIIYTDDIDEAREFLKWLIEVGKEVENDTPISETDTMSTQETTSVDTRAVTHVIYGRSTCSFLNISSVQEVYFVFNEPENTKLTVTDSKINANVGGTWTPNTNSYGPHSFNGQTCNFIVSGQYKYLITRDLTLTCYVEKGSNNLFSKGEVSSCRS